MNRPASDVQPTEDEKYIYFDTPPTLLTLSSVIWKVEADTGVVVQSFYSHCGGNSSINLQMLYFSEQEWIGVSLIYVGGPGTAYNRIDASSLTQISSFTTPGHIPYSI